MSQFVRQDDKNGDFAVVRALKEGKIDFPPTSKFLKSSDDYDKTQNPAYCQRILLKGGTNKEL